MKTVFADTGYWIALLNPRDELHTKAKAVSISLGSLQIITSELVLSELLNSFAARGVHLRQAASALIKGRIDVLVLDHRFWVLVIESKKAEFSLEAARAQILAYMLANPNPHKPVFGLITNGGNFIFVKLAREGSTPQYAFSRVFSLLNPGNDLYDVLGVLKRLS